MYFQHTPVASLDLKRAFDGQHDDTKSSNRYSCGNLENDFN